MTVLPLTLAQEGLAGLEALAPGTSVGTTAEMIVSPVRLDAGALREALRICYRENEQLRARLVTSGERPGQRVSDDEPGLRIVEVDSATAQRRAIEAAVAEPFAPTRESMVRSVLVRGPETDRFVHCAHHLVLDGFGAGLLLRRVAAVYSALVEGLPVPAPVRPAPTVAEIVADDEGRRSAQESAGARLRWDGLRRGLPPVDRPVDRLAGVGRIPVRRAREVPPDVRAGLDRLRRELGVGWQTLLVAGLGGLAATGASCDPVAVGVPASRRTGPGRVIAAASPCTAVTVLPVLVPDGSVTLAEACAEVRRWEEASSSSPAVTQEYLLALDRADGVDRVPSAQINVMPFVQRVDLGGYPALVRNLRVGPVPGWTLTLRGAWESGVRAELDVNPAAYREDDADDLLDRALRRLAVLSRSEPDVPMSALPRSSEVEDSVAAAVGRDSTPVAARTLLEAFTDGVAAHPDRVAVEGEGDRLTYRGLWDRSAALAAALHERGAGRGDVVGLHLPRSVDQVVAAHALLHLGAVYLPLHVDLPEDRRADMCAQADARLVVDRDLLTELAGQDRPLPTVVPAGLDDPAYVLFTSGSTGRPKGVVITHRAIDNRLEWMQHTCLLLPGECVLYKTPCSFDVHIWELYWAYRVGGRVLVAPEGTERDPDALAGLLVSGSVDVVHFVPSMLRALLAVPSVRRRLAEDSRLREIVCSGEALSRGLAESAHDATGVWPLNLYGPTEAAVDVTWFRTREAGQEPDVPLGAPVWNTRCLVLDDAGRALPPGQVGTLWLGGVQLSTGYLGRSDLTAAAFVDHPRHGRIYDTGDLVEWGRDGLLRYHGRRDGQVKIRGQRVELGEIESVLRECPGVEDAVCLVDGDAPVAHLLAPGSVGVDAVRAHAARLLTGAMLPARWAVHDRLPTTTNGKADRRALASLDPRPAPAAGPPPAGPDDDILLAAVRSAFAEVLGVPCGPEENFFERGGDSLACVRLLGALERRAGRAPGLGQVLAAPTPRALAGLLAEGTGPASADAVWLSRGPEHDAGRPLALLPPAGGLCWSYLPLVAHLGARRPVLALQSPLVADPSWNGRTLEELCAWQAGIVAREVPDGPVHLAGWSVGGTCAQAVSASGALDVLSVGLLDAYPSEQWRIRPEPGRRERLGALLRMGGVDETGLDRVVDDADALVEVLAERGSPLAVMGPETVSACLETVRLTSRMIRSHDTRVAAVPTVHVGATASAADGLDADEWAPSAGPFTRVVVDGDHVGVVSPVHAASVAAALLSAGADLPAPAAQ